MKAKATTTWSVTDEIRVAKALGAARDKLRAQLGREPTGSEVISGVFKDVADIDHRTPKDQPREPGNCWVDYTHELDEKTDAAKQRLIDAVAGDDIGFRAKPTEEEIDTAASVGRVFFGSLRGETQERDWRILRYAGRGLSNKKIAESIKPKISRQCVSQRKQDQLGAIWQAVQNLMPAPTKCKRSAPKKTGVIWRNAA